MVYIKRSKYSNCAVSVESRLDPVVYNPSLVQLTIMMSQNLTVGQP